MTYTRRHGVRRNRDGAVTLESIGEGAEEGRTALPGGAGTWLETTLNYMIDEVAAARPGNAAMLARLTELLFVDVLRRYMQQLPGDRSGWLAGLNDAHVGKSLGLMHADPARPWTVGELARGVGISRSALADRFSALIGESPMRYLAGWRMQLAKQLLREGKLRMPEIAAHVGYDSEYAFSRAFKRHVAEPPGTWRKAASPTV